MDKFVFSFHNISPQSKKQLTAAIIQHGGSIAYVGSTITHLITTQEEIKSNSFKIRKAKDSEIQVVTESFVLELVKKYPVKASLPPQSQQPAPSSKAEEVKGSNSVVKFNSEVNQITESTVKIVDPNSSSFTNSSPTVNLILPEYGPCDGIFKVAVFGLNFKPSPFLHVRFGHLISGEIEYHSSTSIIVTLRPSNVTPGEVEVKATNDGGKHYGPSCRFIFFDPTSKLSPIHEENVSSVQLQLENLKRSINQLQSGLQNIQQLEEDLSYRFDTYGIPQAPPKIEEEPISPPVQVPDQPKSTTVLKAKSGRTLELKHDPNDREIRVFISSPFRDMQEERDLIVKKVFPRIRKICVDRDIGFSYVDLRWGVTGAQNEQAATLLMCLREISKCNVFIGCYGERYGWCLSQDSFKTPTTQDELLKRSFDIAGKEFPWIKDFNDRSVTELEMQMILKHQFAGNDKFAWFYFRDPYYLEEVSTDKKNIYRSEGEYEYGKLSALKKEITDSGFPTELYNKPNELEESIYQDLSSHIFQCYPKGSDLSPLESERFRHTSLSKKLERVYLANEQYFMDLDRFVARCTKTPYVLIGESGSGKSALLANWAKRYRQHHPEDIIITHFIGCSSASTDFVKILTRILNEVQDILNDFRTPIPNITDLLISSFPGYLSDILQRNKRSRLVLVLDGLDYLDARENSLDLLWLPQFFPPNVRVVISSSPGKPESVLKRRGYDIITMNPLTEAERISFIRSYLNLSSKKLNEKQEFKIAASPACGNPRYLITLIEDISVWGEFDQLDSKIEQDLTSKDVSELYEIVLNRLQNDYDSANVLIKDFLGYIWGSRRGLYLDTELAQILEGQGVEPHQWSSIYMVLEDLLFSSSGLIKLANKDIELAVEHHYCPNKEKQKEIHTKIAKFFLSIEGYEERKAEEVCWQLEQAEQWEELKKAVSDLRIFDKLCSPSHWDDLTRYWRKIQQYTEYEPVDSYTQSLGYTDQFPSGEVVADIFFRVGTFLEDLGKLKGAESILTRARYYYELASQNLDVAKLDLRLGIVLHSQARYKEAEEHFRRSLQIFIREKGDDCLEASDVCTKLGSLLSDINRMTEAEELLEKALRIRIEKLGQHHASIGETLKYFSTFYELSGNNDKAIEFGERALKIAEEVYGLDHKEVSDILIRLGRLYTTVKRYQLAKKTLKRALSISETKYGAVHSYTADVFYELGTVYLVKPEAIGHGNKKNEKSWSSDKADEFFKKALETKEKCLGLNHPDVARVLNRLGALCIERVEYIQAEEYLKRALKIREDTLGPSHSRVTQSLKHLLTLMELQERYPEAVKVGNRILANTSKQHGLDSVAYATVLVRIGTIHFLADGRGSFEGKRHITKAIEIYTKRCGPESKEVDDANKVLKEFAEPVREQQTVQKVLVSKTAIEELKHKEEEEASLEQFVIESKSFMNEIEEMDEDILDVPPPPPPPPTMIPPPPPPPTGIKVPQTPSSLTSSILNFAEKKNLVNAQSKMKTRNFDRAGWWQQGYHARFDAQKLSRKPAPLPINDSKPKH